MYKESLGQNFHNVVEFTHQIVAGMVWLLTFTKLSHKVFSQMYITEDEEDEKRIQRLEINWVVSSVSSN